MYNNYLLCEVKGVVRDISVFSLSSHLRKRKICSFFIFSNFLFFLSLSLYLTKLFKQTSTKRKCVLIPFSVRKRDYLTLYPTVIFLFSLPLSSHLTKLWDDANDLNCPFLARKRNTISCSNLSIFSASFFLFEETLRRECFLNFCFLKRKGNFLTLYPSENILCSASSHLAKLWDENVSYSLFCKVKGIFDSLSYSNFSILFLVPSYLTKKGIFLNFLFCM